MEPGVAAVVFGRVVGGERDCIVYLARPVTVRQAMELFDRAWKVEPLGQIISLKQALSFYEDPNSDMYGAFDFITHFNP